MTVILYHRGKNEGCEIVFLGEISMEILEYLLQKFSDLKTVKKYKSFSSKFYFYYGNFYRETSNLYKKKIKINLILKTYNFLLEILQELCKRKFDSILQFWRHFNTTWQPTKRYVNSQ